MCQKSGLSPRLQAVTFSACRTRTWLCYATHGKPHTQAIFSAISLAQYNYFPWLCTTHEREVNKSHFSARSPSTCSLCSIALITSAPPPLKSPQLPHRQSQLGTKALRASVCFCTIVYTNSTKVKLHQEGLRKQHLTTMALMNAEFYNQEITML